MDSTQMRATAYDAASFQTMDVLSFILGEHRYAIPLAFVQEVALIVPFTPVGRLPPLVEGVIECRGNVIPVLDLRAHLNVPARPAGPQDHLVILRSGDRNLALRVDQVAGVMRIDPERLHSSDQLKLPPSGVAGIIRLDGLMLLSDVPGFLAAVDQDLLDQWLETVRPGRT
jgi:chemotaxis signal transduction protein